MPDKIKKIEAYLMIALVIWGILAIYFKNSHSEKHDDEPAKVRESNIWESNVYSEASTTTSSSAPIRFITLAEKSEKG